MVLLEMYPNTIQKLDWKVYDREIKTYFQECGKKGLRKSNKLKFEWRIKFRDIREARQSWKSFTLRNIMNLKIFKSKKLFQEWNGKFFSVNNKVGLIKDYQTKEYGLSEIEKLEVEYRTLINYHKSIFQCRRVDLCNTCNRITELEEILKLKKL